MDIQQKLQEQNQQFQQINSKDRFRSISSLDAITDYAISALTEKSPSYFYGYEKAFTKQVREYGVGLI